METLSIIQAGRPRPRCLTEQDVLSALSAQDIDVETARKNAAAAAWVYPDLWVEQIAEKHFKEYERGRELLESYKIVSTSRSAAGLYPAREIKELEAYYGDKIVAPWVRCFAGHIQMSEMAICFTLARRR